MSIILNIMALCLSATGTESQEFTHPNIRFVEAPLMDISATFIRQTIKSGHSVKYLLPQNVEEYIRDKKLFL
jgi:nicotinate-nucleotide adenylyltransferase